MNPTRHSALLKSCWLAVALWAGVLLGRADVLIGTNGDRFTGKVLEETADSVVFDSELGGKFTIPRLHIREIQRTQPPTTDNRSLITNNTPASFTDSSPRDLPVTLACSDRDNDVPTFQWAGFFMAMAHAWPVALRAATHIAPAGPSETALACSI